MVEVTPAPRIPLDRDAVAAAAEVLTRTKVAIFVCAYQAEHFIESVLERIPEPLRPHFAEIYVFDDSSSDRTFERAQAAVDRLGGNVTVFRTPFNRGYGGNQKLGYLHAIRQGYDYVVLLHGDGQYAPEYLPQIVQALGDEQPDALIGSRMINRRDALRGGMPLYKWVGNQVLTRLENRMLGSGLSEFHSGYRAYKVDALRSIPFRLNSDDFHFDTEILVQLLRTGRRIVEIPVPTFYGDEISRVNGMRYAVNCVKAVTKARLQDLGLYYEPKFDFGRFEEAGYVLKAGENTLHQDVLDRDWPADWHVADIGASRGALSALLAEKVAHVTSVDRERPGNAGRAEAIALDLDGDFDEELGHARQFAARIKELYGVVPGSKDFSAEQTFLQPPDQQTDIVHIIRGVIKAETGAIEHYTRIIEETEGIDPVTQDMVISILRDEQGHRRLFEGYLREFEAEGTA